MPLDAARDSGQGAQNTPIQERAPRQVWRAGLSLAGLMVRGTEAAGGHALTSSRRLQQHVAAVWVRAGVRA